MPGWVFRKSYIELAQFQIVAAVSTFLFHFLFPEPSITERSKATSIARLLIAAIRAIFSTQGFPTSSQVLIRLGTGFHFFEAFFLNPKQGGIGIDSIFIIKNNFPQYTIESANSFQARYQLVVPSGGGHTLQ